MKYKPVIIGIFAFLLIWIFVISPELKFSTTSFNELIEQRGLDKIITSDGKLSDPFTIEEVTQYSVQNNIAGTLDIVGRVTGTNLEKNELIFQAEDNFRVDPKTHKNSNEKLGYFILPFNTEKKNYSVYNPLVTTPTTFVFENTLLQNEVELYVFSCDSFDNDFSDAFPQFKFQTILIDYDCEVWVEPTTGNIINHKSFWHAYLVEDGIKTTLEDGGKKHSELSILHNISKTKSQINLIQFYEIIIPAIIGIIGLLVLFDSIIIDRPKNQRKPTKT